VRSTVSTTSLLSGDLRRKIGHTFVGRENTPESLFFDNFYGAFSMEELAQLLSRGEPPYAGMRRFWDDGPHPTALSRMLYTDLKTYLVELLMKQDQMSMACSIESRVPFLDHPLVEFACRVPDSLKIRGGTSKYILKRVAEQYLPPEIVHRKKMGFPTPLRQWLRQPEAVPIFDYLREPGGLLAESLDLKAVQRLVELHRAGQVDGTDRLWRLLNLQIWGDLYVTGRTTRLDEGLLAAVGVGRG
jgi:asparagine synthase (glutamine-hydrolysing)